MLAAGLYLACLAILAGATFLVVADRGLLAPVCVLLKAVLYLAFPVLAVAFAAGQTLEIGIVQALGCMLFFAGALFGAVTLPGSARVSAASPSPMPRDSVPRPELVGALVFLAAVAVFAANVFVTLEYDLLVRRIGTEVIAGRYADLPAWARLALRLWDLFLGAALTFLVFARGSAATPVRLLAVPLWASYFAFTLVSSRLLTVDLLLLVMIARRTSGRVAVLFVFPVAAVMAGVAYMLRTGFDFQDAREGFWSEWVERLDCFSLVGEIDAAMWAVSPPLLGTSWLQSTGGRIWAFFDPEFQQRFVGGAETGSKNFVASEFLLAKGADYPSCLLSDVFANFWLAGALAVGFALVRLTGFLERRLNASSDIAVRCACLAVVAVVLNFDRDLNDMGFNAGVAVALFLAIGLVARSVQRMTNVWAR